MTLGTDADTHVLVCRTRLDDIAASTVNYGVAIIWMNLLFHGFSQGGGLYRRRRLHARTFLAILNPRSATSRETRLGQESEPPAGRFVLISVQPPQPY